MVSKLPHKNPDNWLFISQFLAAPVLAFITAYLRAMYEGKSKKARWLEGSLLGLATVAISPVLEWFGLPNNLAIVFAVTVGFVGVETLKDKIKQRFNEKV